jgi:hypothetical protein
MIRVILACSQSLSDMLAVEFLEGLDDFSLNEEVNQWALEHNFYPSGTFYFKTRRAHMCFTTWMEAQQHTILLFLFCRQISKNNRYNYEIAENSSIEFSTQFEPDISLSTSNSESVHTLPGRPKEYKESFPGISIEVIYRKHSDSIAFLTKRSNLKIRPIKEPVNNLLLESMHEDCKYAKSIPWWPLKSIYWHFARKYLWQNLTIQQQYEKGKIKLS